MSLVDLDASVEVLMEAVVVGSCLCLVSEAAAVAASFDLGFQ